MNDQNSFRVSFSKQIGLDIFKGEIEKIKIITPDLDIKYHLDNINNQRVPKSKIILVTFFQIRGQILPEGLYQDFQKYGTIKKIVVFEKKTKQAFIEFDTNLEA